MKRNDFARTGLPVIMVALSLSFCGAAFGQGISEYAGVSSIPKPVPGASGGMSNALNSLYGAPGKALGGVTAGGAQGSTPSPSGKTQTYGKGKGAKTSAQTPIMSGDLPGASANLARANLIKLSGEADTAYHTGLAAKQKGKLAEAEPLLKKSVAIRAKYWADRDKLIPDIYVHLGEIYSNKGDDAKAAESLQQALSYYSRFYGPGSDHRIKPLFLLSDVDYRLGEKGQGYDYFKQAYLLAERGKLAEYNPVELRLTTGKKALELEKFRDAEELFEKAVSDKERTKLSPDQLVTAMNDYATALKGLHRDRDAEEVLAEIERIKGSQGSAPPAQEKTEESAK